MSTRANVVIRNGSKGCDRLLYHHFDGDMIGELIRRFLREVPTGNADDFTDFLKDYTCEEWGYIANRFEDAKVISTDIDYIYYVDCYGRGIKTVTGYKFPTSISSRVVEGAAYIDDIDSLEKLWDKFSSSRDFTEEQIRKYWLQSFYYVHGVPEEELGGGPAPKKKEA